MPRQPTTAGLIRRLGAMCYDTLALAAVLMLATSLLLLLTGGAAISPSATGAAGFAAYQASLVLLTGGFFVFFWLHGGQTLGMLAWRLRVVRRDGTALRLTDALMRLAAAVLSWLPLGLGFVWAAFDPERRAWHDTLSRTRLVVVPKPSAQARQSERQTGQ